jgi:hypothetical protein
MTDMKRVFTATCIAAMFAVGLAAQSTGTAGTSSQEPQAAAGGQGRGGGPRTVTGCLRAGDTAGSYMLTDIVMQGGGAGAGATTTGSTASGTGTATAGGQRQGGAPMSAMLVPDAGIDLKPHVGHKVEITGSRVGGGGRRGGGDGAATGTATATGSTTTGGAATTATGTGTGSTSGTGTGTGATGTGQGRGGPMQMSVTALRMVSESCS